jgi:hypothetical protein
LCAKHFYGKAISPTFRDAALDASSDAASTSDVRTFLSFVTSHQSTFIPASAHAEINTWAIHRVVGKLGPPGFRMCYVCAPGEEARVGKLVTTVLAPSAARATLLLREATGRSHERVDIVFVASPSPRLLPEEPRGAVAPEHINGGVTFFRYSPPRVLVWREEDAEKVIVHELVHRFGIDEALRLNTPLEMAAEARLAARYGVHTTGVQLGVNEAYTEALACVLYVHLSCARTSTGTSTGTGSGVDGALTVASQHFAELASRLARHFGLSPEHPFAYTESTHAFAYVACRAALFQPAHLERLLLDHPPRSPPTDMEAFVRRLSVALDDLRHSLATRGAARSSASRRLSAVDRSIDHSPPPSSTP